MVKREEGAEGGDVGTAARSSVLQVSMCIAQQNGPPNTVLPSILYTLLHNPSNTPVSAVKVERHPRYGHCAASSVPLSLSGGSNMHWSLNAE
eukprot:SAG31_NODE_37_length_31616_cov_38.688359_15_plen_92_part_00